MFLQFKYNLRYNYKTRTIKNVGGRKMLRIHPVENIFVLYIYYNILKYIVNEIDINIH